MHTDRAAAPAIAYPLTTHTGIAVRLGALRSDAAGGLYSTDHYACCGGVGTRMRRSCGTCGAATDERPDAPLSDLARLLVETLGLPLIVSA